MDWPEAITMCCICVTGAFAYWVHSHYSFKMADMVDKTAMRQLLEDDDAQS